MPGSTNIEVGRTQMKFSKGAPSFGKSYTVVLLKKIVLCQHRVQDTCLNLGCHGGRRCREMSERIPKATIWKVDGQKDVMEQLLR